MAHLHTLGLHVTEFITELLGDTASEPERPCSLRLVLKPGASLSVNAKPGANQTELDTQEQQAELCAVTLRPWYRCLSHWTATVYITAHFACTGAVITLVIKFFYMTFQNSPLFSDAVCKLLSHGITRKAPYTLSAQLPSIIFNIRDNL